MTTARPFLGTVAWAYDSWKPNFYPQNLAQSQWLMFYSSHFNTVEVDSTFYHTPSEQVLKNWKEKTPENFLFCAKAPRRITHELKLRKVELDVETFLHALSQLGSKLGVVLFQFPHSFTSAYSHTFIQFLKILPANFSYAIEFRDKSWNAPRFDELLREHAIIRVWNDVGKRGEIGAFLHREQTAPEVYVRLLGDIAHKYDASGQVIHYYDRLQWPRNEELEAWVTRLKSLEQTRRFFVFAANHYEGFATETIKRLSQKLGLNNAQTEPHTFSLPPIQKEFWT